ncbi:carbon-nitrogen hydrolase family protein [Brevibacterium salitolerans]|uniref:Carbon-nitrogen hydrolase family protein n=1 Tax=Brevibacterium salitolerans TaxID=1403566 RepID=A0ABN2WZM0_9MICO
MRVAISQFGASRTIAENTARIVSDAHRAGEAGASLMVCPEASMIRLPDKDESLVGRVEPVEGSFGTGLALASEETGVTIVAGGFTPGDASRVKNTLFVASGGRIIATYDKIHLYDAFSDKESDKVLAGPVEPVTVDVEGVRIGLATCYDLRFPELFRDLADRGSLLVAVPTAWVKGPLKEEHWLTLLRARAIENSFFIVGSGEAGVRSIGRSAAFDPMGLQLTDLGAGDGFGVVDMDIGKVAETRRANPSVHNRRYAVLPRSGDE